MDATALRERHDAPPATLAADSFSRWEKVLTWAPLILLPLACALVASALPAIDLRAMNDYGIVSVLPVRIWASLLLILVSFATCWWRGKALGPLLSLHVVLFIVLFYGIPPMVSEAGRGPIVYRHLGIAEYLTRERVIDTRLDVYFNWPGFFMGLGSLIEIGRLEDKAVTIARWASVAVNLCYFPVLLALFRAFTRDMRLVWAATLFFFVANWINQDYLAPQSFTYVLYLAALVLVLHYLRPLDSSTGSRWTKIRVPQFLTGLRSGALPADVPVTATAGRTGLAVTAVVIGLFTASVTAHQLTPFAILFAISLLVVTRQCRMHGLPIVMVVILAAWTLIAASGYIDGNLERIAASSGVASSIEANVGSRLAGSSQHLVVVWIRLAMTGCILLLALAGAIRRFRAGHRDHAAAILALSPLPLFLLPYGGEVILRLYFFLLPFVSFFAATLFLPTKKARHTFLHSSPQPGLASRAVLLAVIMSVVLGAGFPARYGNERMDFYTPEEVAAVEELYRVAPPGSVLMAAVNYLPWRYQEYEWDRNDGTRGHRYLSVATEWSEDPAKSPEEMAAWASETLTRRPAERRPAGFLIVTRSQLAHQQILGGLEEEPLEAFLVALEKSNDFRIIFENRDATIYARITSDGRGNIP